MGDAAARGPQDGRGEGGSAGLAVRAGDADEAQLARGVIIEGGGHEGQRVASIGDENLGDAARVHGLADHDRGRAARHGLRHETMPVKGGPA